MAKIKKTDDTKCCRARGGISTLTYCSQGHTTMPQNSLTEQIPDLKKKKTTCTHATFFLTLAVQQ